MAKGTHLTFHNHSPAFLLLSKGEVKIQLFNIVTMDRLLLITGNYQRLALKAVG